MLDVLPHVNQPLPPSVETIFSRIEGSQALMEKLLGELNVRIGPEVALRRERSREHD
jgi:hypothetical protein